MDNTSCLPCRRRHAESTKTRSSHGLNGFSGWGASIRQFIAPHPLNPFNPWLFRVFVLPCLTDYFGFFRLQPHVYCRVIGVGTLCPPGMRKTWPGMLDDPL